MAVSDWSATASNNTTVGGVNIAEGCSPAGINNAIREVMADVKAFSLTVPSAASPLTVSAVWTYSAQPVFEAGAKWNDSDSATFGTGNDFSITHNGSNTVLSQTGTGGLFIDSASGIFLRSPSADVQVEIAANGAVILAHDGNDKLTTTSTGVTVTGTVTADGFAGAGLITEAEGIPSNDNDTTVPSSAAVKDYVDDTIAALPVAGWQLVSTLYDFAVSGAVAAVETSDFADGYEYLIVADDISSSATASPRLRVYRATSAAYSGYVDIYSPADLTSDREYTVDAIFRLPRITKKSHVVACNIYGSTGATIPDSEGLVTTVATFAVTHATAQKLLRAELSFTAGNIDGGTVRLYRRPGG